MGHCDVKYQQEQAAFEDFVAQGGGGGMEEGARNISCRWIDKTGPGMVHARKIAPNGGLSEVPTPHRVAILGGMQSIWT